MEFIKYNDGIYQYLDVNVEKGVSVDKFALQTLSEMPADVIKCVCINETPAVFKFGLNGVTSLGRQLSIGLPSQRALNTIKLLAEKMLVLSDYLIDIRQVYLTDETIYIDVLTGDVRLLLIPVIDGDGFVDFKEWFLAHLATWRSATYKQYYVDLQEYASSNDFCIDGLITLIDQLFSNNVIKSATKLSENERSVKEIKKNDEISDRSFKWNKLKQILFTVVLQLLFALVYLVVYLKIPSYTGNVVTARLGTLLIIIGFDIYITQLTAKFLSQYIFKIINKMPDFVGGTSKSSKIGNCSFETTLLREAIRDSSYLLDLSTNQKYTISGKRTLIGRQPEKVDIFLAAKTIGRRHCQIELSDEHYQIRDLDSKNGTFVNDRKVVNPLAMRLSNGDKISIADQTLIFFET